MKKKLFLITLLVFAFISFLSFINVVKAAEPTYDVDTGYVLNGTQKCFFANGVPISIEARADGAAGATIFWDNGTKSANVPSDINIFGGAHKDGTTYESTHITMNGGTIKNIFGGGLHESYVTTSNVTINGGKVTGSAVGGGANVLSNSDKCSPTGVTAENSKTRVVNANLTINNGTVNMVYGGGEGLSNTAYAVVRINGGNISYLTAGGSNGYTGNTDVKITSGTINLFQSVNRGEVNSANVRVAGGTIDKLYVGGEEDSNVTGTISNIALDITGGTVVNNLYIGTSGGTKLGADTNVDLDIYLGATVHMVDENEFANIAVTEYIFVTIDNNRYELPKGKTLKDLPELEGIKNVAGKEFVKFVVKGTDEVFSEDTEIIGNTEISTVYKDKVVEKPMDDTPKTGENNIGEIFEVSLIIWLVIGLVVMSKFKT